MAGIGIERATKVFARTTAIKGISLDIKDGEFMVLLGPSGCGKTTLLRCIAGLEHLDDGRITIGDRDVTDLAPRHRGIAMVFQSYAVFPHMTVEDNIGFGLRMHRRPKAEITRRVAEGAELLGLTNLLARYPAQLSGGQRQRVAVARALVMDAPVLLMDEPLSNLDALLRLQARADLKRLHKEVKRTTIYVTHDQVEAMSMGDRIAVMREGSIEQVGAPMEIYDRPASQFVGGFIGSPPMNFLRGSVRAGSFEGDGFAFPIARVPARADGRGLLLGVRAEHLRIGEQGVPARISVVEPLGDHALVTALVGKTPIKVQAPIDVRAKPDDNVRLAFDESKARWMDAESGAAL
ncbi:MAG: sugar ABC transporter ATP-binding protein [Chloroflexi bacterium 13_1_40CM_68_15]|nr:MAG: sugar ABC transporter ATP-binding protein [Chloroflexi bacterium 13_1_40CM_68_15]